MWKIPLPSSPTSNETVTTLAGLSFFTKNQIVPGLARVFPIAEPRIELRRAHLLPLRFGQFCHSKICFCPLGLMGKGHCDRFLQRFKTMPPSRRTGARHRGAVCIRSHDDRRLTRVLVRSCSRSVPNPREFDAAWRENFPGHTLRHTCQQRSDASNVLPRRRCTVSNCPAVRCGTMS